MHSRLKTFLAFSLFCLLPLLIVSVVAFLINLKLSERLLSSELEYERARIVSQFETVLRDNQNDLLALASSIGKQNELTTAAPTSTVHDSANSIGAHRDTEAESPVSAQIRADVAGVIRHRNYYANIALFSSEKRPVFVAEAHSQTPGNVIFRTKNVLVDQIQPHTSAWSMKDGQVNCEVVRQATLGQSLRCTTPVFFESASSERGALVADIKLASVVSEIVGRPELTRCCGLRDSQVVTVLDDSGNIVYHTNDAIKHQPSNDAIPEFAPVATAMIAGSHGTKFYSPTSGDSWLAAYGKLMAPRLSVAVARNYSVVTSSARRWGWLMMLAALLIGTLTTVFLTNFYHQKTKSIDTVAAGVGAIVKGELDHRIDLRSSDDLRPVADNLGLMTKQLREQIAREAESRQFQSFVRLSAVLTHDLKNSIEALSLTVSNMERHFENADFRADAMKTLRSATENLRSLVTRLSTPVTTLSGEHKRPVPSDLIPMLKRVISMTAAQADGPFQTKLDLPESLLALVDMERMQKVAENLIINALEAMTPNGGTLTIAAGKTSDGKTSFSVSDTGAGMSQRFIEERLFRPFATTKKRGVGLGLYTCREVVRANGGSIEVESKEGAGTTFRVVLPSAAFDKSAETKQKKPHR